MAGGIAPAIREHCSFNIGGNGLNGIFGKQLASPSKNALQQAGPMLPNRPVSMVWKISVIHPGIFITDDDQHLIISGNPGMPGLGWNGKGNGRCGNWAFVETTTHMITRRRRTFLRNILRKKLEMIKKCKSLWSLFLIDEQ